MSKKVIIVIISTAVVALFIIIAFWLVSVLAIGISQKDNGETLLMTSESPDGQYTVEAYKTEPGATVDFSIKVYMVANNDKTIIYNAYHEYEASIYWISNSEISINGKTLNLSKGETYDWRNN